MSQLEQIKKLLTFKEIVPKWFQQLTTGNTDKSLDIGQYRLCVVGEAHGFAGGKIEIAMDKAIESHYHGCKTCMNFSFDYDGEIDFFHKFNDPDTDDTRIFSEEDLDNDPTIQAFVKHWNEVHVK